MSASAELAVPPLAVPILASLAIVRVTARGRELTPEQSQRVQQMMERMRQQQRHTPVLMVTARDAISDCVTGLNQGAIAYAALEQLTVNTGAQADALLVETTGGVVLVPKPASVIASARCKSGASSPPSCAPG